MRYVIIGNGAAGIAAAEAIRRCDARGEITLLSDEPHAAYYRPLIQYVLYDAPETASLYRDALHLPRDVNMRLNTRVESLAVNEHQVTLAGGETLSYDKLLLATGAAPVRVPIIGVGSPSVFAFRTLDDVLAIKAAAQDAQRAVVIGGGFIGTKAALALRHMGLEVTIVEMLKWIVPQQLDASAAQIFHAALRAEGITLLFGRGALRITQRKGDLKSVSLDDGTKLPADLIVIAAGVKPNAELARAAGIAVQRGIQVNACLETNATDVYAAGDVVVVETEGIISGESAVGGIWTNAVEMGHVAGENMAGGHREYDGGLSVLNSTDFAGIAVVAVGVVNPPARRGYEIHVQQNGTCYRKLVFREDALVGALFVGEIEKSGVYAALIRERADVRAVKAEMLANRLSYAYRLRGPLATAEVYAA